MKKDPFWLGVTGLIVVILLTGVIPILAQSMPGLKLGGTGTNSTKTQGAIPYVASGGNAFDFTSITSGQFMRGGGTGAPTGLDLFGSTNTWTAAQNFSGGVSTPSAASPPATCTVGDIFTDNNALQGMRFCVCESANTWQCPANALRIITDSTAYLGIHTINFPNGTSTNSPAQVVTFNGLKIQEQDGTPSGVFATIKFPNGTVTDNGGNIFSVKTAPTGTSPPATCAVGELFFDTDATTGKRLCVCDSTNTWKCPATAWTTP